MRQHDPHDNRVLALKNEKRRAGQTWWRHKRNLIPRRNTPELSEPPPRDDVALESPKMVHVGLAFVRRYLRAESVTDGKCIGEPSERLETEWQDFCAEVRAKHQGEINIRKGLSIANQLYMHTWRSEPAKSHGARTRCSLIDVGRRDEKIGSETKGSAVKFAAVQVKQSVAFVTSSCEYGKTGMMRIQQIVLLKCIDPISSA